MELYLSLFFSFFKIGLFGFGGGYAMLSLIQHEVVEKHEWISMSDFTDIVAISQSTPGPIAFNSATYIGYTATQKRHDVFYGFFHADVFLFGTKIIFPAISHGLSFYAHKKAWLFCGSYFLSL